MKSLGLALAIFSLTGALAGLGISLAHRVQTSNPKVMQFESTPRVQHGAVSSDAASNAVVAKDEADGVVINAFLILPRMPPQVGIKSAAELRYD